MNSVQVLPDIVINKIAAGEVVERPASAVKELVENALDADATDIGVEVKDGGLSLIRVTDNGAGMTPADLHLAVRRHATSKIRAAEDLQAIDSLGFRGEALPSIASVSRTTVTTRTPDALGGARLRIDGGVAGSPEDGPRAPGTTVEVENLFYNVPARRKFLKSATTELRHISRVMTEYSLAYEDVTFTLVHNGRRMFRYAAVDTPAERAAQVFGRKTAERLVPVDYRTDGLTVGGFAGKPEIARNTSRHLIIFVNRRAITNRTITHAVTEGYRGLLQRGEYPFGTLFLTVDPARVDVNVHPAKREVRFTDERAVHSHVHRAVRAALEAAELVRNIDAGPAPGVYTPSPEGSAAVRSFMDRQKRAAAEAASPQNELFPAGSLPAQEQTPADEVQDAAPLPPLPDNGPAGTAEGAPQVPAGGFWQVRNTYIFSATDEGVLIIDQHAAHERILFEEALDGLHERSASAQQMLFPVTLELTHPEFVLMEKALPEFEKLGFGIRLFGGTSVVVDALPASARGWKDGRLLREMLEELGDYGAASGDWLHKLAASYACKAAVKAGDPLKPGEIAFLVHRLFKSSQPYSCPHGRPCAIRMTYRELEKKFGRTT